MSDTEEQVERVRAFLDREAMPIFRTTRGIADRLKMTEQDVMVYLLDF